MYYFFLIKPIKIDVLEMVKKNTILANKSKGLSRVSVKGNHEIYVYVIKHFFYFYVHKSHSITVKMNIRCLFASSRSKIDKIKGSASKQNTSSIQ